MSKQIVLTTQEKSDAQRAEAKRLLNSAFGWGENFTCDAINQAIDCIIGAAILGTAAVQQEALAELQGKSDE